MRRESLRAFVISNDWELVISDGWEVVVRNGLISSSGKGISPVNGSVFVVVVVVSIGGLVSARFESKLEPMKRVKE